MYEIILILYFACYFRLFLDTGKVYNLAFYIITEKSLKRASKLGNGIRKQIRKQLARVYSDSKWLSERKNINLV